MNYESFQERFLESQTTVYLADEGAGHVQWFSADEDVDYVVTDKTLQMYSLSSMYTSSPSLPVPARLAIVARVSPLSFEMSTNRFYCPSNGMFSPSDPKQASALFEDPEPTLVSSPFKTAYKILSHIATLPMQAHTTLCGENGLLEHTNRRPMIRLYHDLFMDAYDKRNVEVTNPLINVLDDEEFFIHNWPSSTVQGKEAIDAMVDTAHVVPLPAYDEYDKLIRPRNYRRKLERALVWVEFSMRHKTNVYQTHEFSGQLERLCVICPPRVREIPDARHPWVDADSNTSSSDDGYA